MFSVIISLFRILSASKIFYEAGNLYTYDFHSAARIEAMNSEQDTRVQQFAMTCTANFMCMYAGAGEFLFEMTAKNVRISQNIDGDYSVLSGKKSKLESIFARPVIFTLNEAGEISNVKASSEDSEEIVNIKTTIINSLRTHASDQQDATKVEVDTQGVHESHYEITDAEDETEISGYFSEKDFFYFRDPKITEDDIFLSGEQTTRLSDGLVKDSVQSTYVSFNSPPDLFMDSTDFASVMMTSEGSSMLTLNKVAASNAEPFVATSAAAAIASNYHDLKPVSFLDDSFYAERPDKAVHLDQSVVKKDCPEGFELCKSYGLSYWIGNSSCGVELDGSIVTGTNKGCEKESRDLLLGAYANLNLYVLDHKISLLDARAEYSYVDGSVQSNGVDILLFNRSVYNKTFPDLPCIQKSKVIKPMKKTFSMKYTVYVTILPVTFKVGAQLQFEAEIPYEMCLATWEASVSFIPSVTVSLFADVSASILLARGGIMMSANVSEKIDPTAYLSIGKCQVGVKASSYTTPFSAKFVGHVQIRDCTDWCSWGEEKEYVFWKWSSKAVRKELFDIYEKL
ncbi:putative lipid transport family protein [Monocercomonoides exilis]|uniref:putative lipid transport family protein n=1 Tax=Monocercomonoides exilis TaxID=2049356 RepID=UPI003559CFAF|nr:putative lipid transport family protein [Monocercomonoides exilis]|eukprot:MONOS_1177.1-p1 / transcript=MONOS_1177.1 / gene=MONOS_1177 / organism=Monocercomonoides_exilis_PA203 / gene_product=lipid transport family protein / transcript_product=lipid transport family protein / location=Mono_scaffold00020:47806-49509(+) / protein_length=567 / sequence_SO=supercontig / SO=protein_coding / is_pseudo=false